MDNCDLPETKHCLAPGLYLHHIVYPLPECHNAVRSYVLYNPRTSENFYQSRNLAFLNAHPYT